jgi:GDP-L-fucose synthase
MDKTDRIFVAGHRGMVGSACVRALKAAGYENIVVRTHRELDLLDPAAVRAFYAAEKPDVALIAAAKVGGIGANSAGNAEFLYQNEMIAMNTVMGAYEAGVKRLLFLGSTCIYPRMAPQPIPESALLTSELEKTNEGYALAKISGLKLCEFLRRDRGVCYHSLMPTNLYGTGDNYDVVGGHVLPTMIRKFETARVNGDATVPLWGTGTPLREFLHVDDLAAACLFMLNLENPPDLVNVGSGREVTIRQLAEMVQAATGCRAFIEWDRSKPDGTPRKLCDTRLIRSLGWSPKIDLASGLRRTVDEYRAELASGRIRLGEGS